MIWLCIMACRVKNIFFLCVADRYVRVVRYNNWIHSVAFEIPNPLKKDEPCSAT